MTQPAAATRPSAKVWKLTSFLSGTANEIAHAINHPVIELADRFNAKEQALSDQKRLTDRATAAALAEIRRLPKFEKHRAEYESRRTEVEALRSANAATAIRLKASSQMNQSLAAMKAMEKQQLATNPLVVRAKSDLKQQQADRDQAARSLGASLQKQLAWRNQLVSAIRTTFRIQGPLGIGADGLLGDFTPINIIGPRQVVAEYRVFERVEDGGRVADGITSFSAMVHRYVVLIENVSTSSLKVGVASSRDQHFRVADYAPRPHEWGLDMPLMIYRLEKVQRSDLDELFERINAFQAPDISTWASK